MADAAARTASTLKQLKEGFVSGHSGGPVWEVNALCSVAPAAYFFWAVLQSRYRFFESPSNPVIAYAVDFLLNVVALLAATTVYSKSLGLLLALLVVPAVSIYLTAPAAPSSSSTTSTGSSSSRAKARAAVAGKNGTSSAVSSSSSSATPASRPNDFPIRPYLTAYRAGMLVITAICILAVDFRVFPRRFAKVETWGTSLMDVGVGSFVFSGGIIAAKPSIRARMASSSAPATSSIKPSSSSSTTSSKTPRTPSFLSNLAAALRSSLPLLILGFVRLWSVKGLDYAEHVSEYGVHWNFFFTLGCLPIAMALFVDPILALLPSTPASSTRRLPVHALLGLAITLLHGLALSLRLTSLREWALTAPRVGLLAQNREGVVSLAGYLAIFLFGMEAGGVVLPRTPAVGLGALLSGDAGSGTAMNARKQRRNTLLILAGTGCLYAAIAWLLVNPISVGFTAPGPPVSRRLANPPYVLWIAAFNHMQILLYAVVETLLFPGASGGASGAGSKGATKMADADEERREAGRAVSDVLASYNAGGLALFLISNLGTGLVNLTVDTLHASGQKAMAILLAYMATCTASAVLVAKSGWKLKF